MMMLLKILLVFYLIYSLHWQCIVSGRGGGRSSSRSKSSHSYKSSKSSSHSSGGGGGGWFSWFRGSSGSSSSGSNSGSVSNNKPSSVSTIRDSKRSSPPHLSYKDKVSQSPSHIGFAAYGNNYETNFHNSQPHHFQPVSHPYQSHFQPQTTGKQN